ncbi:MAG: flavin reductase [Desulfobacterales bacterium]|nr:flavin reductase [Desulfobacterales bacterium]
MQKVFFLLRRADIIVMATPVFFYGPTAQLKALIDRAQTLWSRKYVHKLVDPGEKWRCGFFISVGATKGKDLFEGISLTAKYFFDAVGAKFEGNLTYPKIEAPEDIEKHPTAFDDAKGKAKSLVAPFLDRKRVLFLCTENACRSQMAGAFAGHYAGDRLDVDSAGSSPANEINPVMEDAMKEKGIDMAYRKPKSLEDVAKDWVPDIIVSMGCGDVCPMFPGVETIAWDLPDPAGKPIEFMCGVRDDIEKRVKDLFL